MTAPRPVEVENQGVSIRSGVLDPNSARERLFDVAHFRRCTESVPSAQRALDWSSLKALLGRHKSASTKDGVSLVGFFALPPRTPRGRANVIHASAVGLDCDACHPDHLHKKLRDANVTHVIYSTYSSTAAARRARVVRISAIVDGRFSLIADAISA